MRGLNSPNIIAAIKGEQPIEDKITFIRGNDRLEQLRKNNS
jgi:nicotinic acid mononucleotide adenylyltransferase